MKPHRFWEFSFRTDLLWLILIGIVIVVAILIVFRSQQEQTKAKRLTDKQKETLETIDSQILSMLIQHGGSLKQNEIAINLDLPQEIITSTLLDLEKQDMISREWLSDEFTFRISKK